MEKMKQIGQVCWMFSVFILLGMTSISWIQKNRAFENPEAPQLAAEATVSTDAPRPLEAVVQPSGPAWATVITETETAAPAAKFYEGGRLYGLEADGEIIQPQVSGVLYDLPLITGINLPSDFSGDFSTVSGGRILLDCIGYMREFAPRLLYQISEIHYEPNIGIILYMIKDTKPVLLGKTNVISRIKKWQYSFEKLAYDFHQARYVDLRFDSQIVVKL